MADNNIAKSPEIMQQINLLNLRINDLMIQLNTTLKTILNENTAMQKENTDLKTKQEKQQ